MKKYAFLLVLTLATLLVGCDSNPAWDGPKPNDKADRLAAGTCKCLYEMAGKEPTWDLDKVMTEVKAIRKATKRDLQSAVFESESPSILKALSNEEDFSMKMDECECMKPIQDGLLEQGVSFDAMMGQLDKHCLLGAFYN